MPKLGVTVPIIIRLTGTNSEEALKNLNNFSKEQKGKFNFITACDLDQAAEFTVQNMKIVENKSYI